MTIVNKNRIDKFPKFAKLAEVYWVLSIETLVIEDVMYRKGMTLCGVQQENQTSTCDISRNTIWKSTIREQCTFHISSLRLC